MLTPSEQRTFKFVQQYFLKNGYAPTLQEIAKGIGIKSRGIYETPVGTLLMAAHRAIESVTLDKETMHKKDAVMPKYAELIYNGYWFSPERKAIQAMIDETQKNVEGEVKLKLYKGNVTVVGRDSDRTLFSSDFKLKSVNFIYVCYL